MFFYSAARRVVNYFREKKRTGYINDLKRKGLNIGRNVSIVDSFFFDPSHCFLISIGDNCTICPNVRLIAHDASTKRILGYTKIGKIDIKENCFIGDSAIILPHVTVGPHSIVGAGSIVTKDVPPNTVVAGNPARVISALDEYLKKIVNLRERKQLFSEDYFIENLNNAKRQEMLRSIGDSIGFIV
jgi:maltose O-acetyltransferase